jgi:hypothetical protein
LNSNVSTVLTSKTGNNSASSAIQGGKWV